MKLGKSREPQRSLLPSGEVLGISDNRQEQPETIPSADFLAIQAYIDQGPEHAPPVYFHDVWYFLELQPGTILDEDRKQKIISHAVAKINEIRLLSKKKEEKRHDYDWRPYLPAVAILRRLAPNLVSTDPGLQVDQLVRQEVGRLLDRDIVDSSMRGETDWMGVLSDSLHILIALPELLPLIKKKIVEAHYWGGHKFLTKAREEIGHYSSDDILVYPALMKVLSLLEDQTNGTRLTPAEQEAMRLLHDHANTGSQLTRHLPRSYFKNIIKARTVTRSPGGTLVFHWEVALPNSRPLPERQLI